MDHDPRAAAGTLLDRDLPIVELRVVLEVVEDTIFEGIHTFFAGTDEEHPFLVERLDDPQRVVIDVHHG
jgi:hypothetical protein